MHKHHSTITYIHYVPIHIVYKMYIHTFIPSVKFLRTLTLTLYLSHFIQTVMQRRPSRSQAFVELQSVNTERGYCSFWPLIGWSMVWSIYSLTGRGKHLNPHHDIFIYLKLCQIELTSHNSSGITYLFFFLIFSHLHTHIATLLLFLTQYIFALKLNNDFEVKVSTKSFNFRLNS